MIQIAASQVTPAFFSLFDFKTPTGIRALAVLSGGNTGKILADHPTDPGWALVWEADDGTLYRGGSYDRQVLAEAVALLRKEGLVALGFREDTPDVEWFPPDPDAGAECLEFDRPMGGSDLSPYLASLPAGFEIHRMDRALLERSTKHDENLNRYGSLENFLDHGIAVGIMHGGVIVCEAYADMDILGCREIGIRTQTSYRRQGLATTACAHLIKLCEEAGSSTYWDCVKLNAGSVQLARKLGFRNQRTYKLLAWFKLERES